MFSTRALGVLTITCLIIAGCSSSSITATDQALPTNPPPTAVAATATGVPATPSPDITTPTTPPPPGNEPARRACVNSVDYPDLLHIYENPDPAAQIYGTVLPLSCGLTLDDTTNVDGWAHVSSATDSGVTVGWVRAENLIPASPAPSIDGAALGFVDAWIAGTDTSPFSYQVGPLPEPGDQTLRFPIVRSPGCELVGDITVECPMSLIDMSGTRYMDMTIGGSQRGTNGYGDEFFPDDYPDGPTVDSFIIDSEYPDGFESPDDFSTVSSAGIGPIRVGMSIAEVRSGVSYVFPADNRPDSEVVGPDTYCVEMRTPALPGVLIMAGGFDDGPILDLGAAEVKAIYVDNNYSITTPSGVRLGNTEQSVIDRFPDSLDISPHKYTEGKYLTFVPADSDDPFTVRFATSPDGHVEQILAGYYDWATLVEGCL